MTEADAALVARARLGDAAAFELLMRRHFRAAYVIALAQLGERSDAEDVCQEAFIRCWERLNECRDPARFGAWLARIVRNTAHNRRDYLRLRATESLEQVAGVPHRASAEADLERRELAARLRTALAQLREVQREIVLLHDLEGWQHAEIAERLEISETMSRRHLSDARKRLRQLLGEYAALEGSDG
jgi:RNA polymerase sigma-70 factor (ECF subfamily)